MSMKFWFVAFSDMIGYVFVALNVISQISNRFGLLHEIPRTFRNSGPVANPG